MSFIYKLTSNKAKIIRAFKDPLFALGLILNQIAPLIKNDELFLKWDYYTVFHRFPNLKKPQTYNEKLQWLKLHDKHPEYTQMVDKAEVKKYVANIIGEKYIIPTLGVFNSFDEIDFEKLPNQFVMKCTHDSGGVVVCKDKIILDVQKARKKIEYGLNKSAYWATREYPYKNITPRIIIEQYMEDNSMGENEDLTDYKIYCCNGKVVCIMTCTDRSKGVKFHFFSPQWEFLRWDHITQYEPEGFTMPRPQNLDEMIDVATKLSANMPEVRVDLYSVKGKTYFGEMTFFSNSGLDTDLTKEADQLLGSYLTLPQMG